MKRKATISQPRKAKKAHRPAKARRSRGAKEQLLFAFRNMLRARKIDDKAILLYKQNKCHFQISCAGHEAIQTAFAQTLKPGYDWAYPYYRDMAFCSGWGMSNREFLLQIMNKAGDPAGAGRQMPMHYGHKDLNIVNQSSPTGTQYLQAVGAAKAMQYVGKDQVVYVSSGEGTTAQGDYHEALNWAAREKLPVIFVIQNNKYAISVHISNQVAGESVQGISSGYEGLNVVTVNGLDYFESLHIASEATRRARSGEGPTVIVAEVVRLQSHSISDNQAKYRSELELARDVERDPITIFTQHLIRSNVASRKELQEIEKLLDEELEQDLLWAEDQPDPDPATATQEVYAQPEPWIGVEEQHPRGEDIFMVEALNHALHEELERNDKMVIYGQDVAYGKGGVFSVTAGLTDRFGEARVFNSPLAESSIVGTAVGIATVGLKPVVEIQFGDYIWTAMMQLRNELCLMRYRSNGAFSCPAVVRVAVGGYIHGGIYHSQNIEATFSHFPGLFVVYPSNASDAKGLLKSAIRGSDPVIFLEHKGLYRQVYAKGPEGGADDLTPIGKARIVREGTDATIVTWGALVQKSILAAEAAEQEGYSVEIIDLRTIYPFDSEAVLSSVRKTSRLLIAHEDVLFMGFGAEVAAQVVEKAFDALDAPPLRVAGAFAPVPHSPVLEEAVLPDSHDVQEALFRLLHY